MVYTRDFVESLTRIHLAVPETAPRTVDQCVWRACSAALKLASQRQMAPVELIDRKQLIDLVAQAGLPQDFDAVEVFALSLMAGRVNKLHLPDHHLAVRRLITTRIHDLLETRPELLHDRLRFPRQGEVARTLLWHMVLSGVVLDPSRLEAMAAEEGFAGQTLRVALQHGKAFGTPLFQAALNRTTGCASTALALLRADAQSQELDEDLITRLRGAVAAASSCRQFQFDSYLELMRALRSQQDAAGGDGHRCAWPGDWSGEGSVNLPSGPDLDSAPAAHPVFGLLYDTTVISAVDDSTSVSEVPGFPARPMALAAAALNALLEPGRRLDLGRLSGMDILTLSTLCPAATGNGPIPGFWRGLRAESAEHSPRAMLSWAISLAAERSEPIALEFFDTDAQLKNVLGPQHVSMRAEVVSAVMTNAIHMSPPAWTSSPSPASAPEPRTARRAARAL